ncbi:hypothetical protein GQ472_06270 [archaeon]|nr:hypothetical protein [archaeon]
MEVKIFWQDNCPNCSPAKLVVHDVMEDMGLKVKEFNVNDVEGMSEAAFHAVMGTPTTIVVDSDDSEIISWRSQIPSREELIDAIKN